jgi:hypothetical protein
MNPPKQTLSSGPYCVKSIKSTTEMKSKMKLYNFHLTYICILSQLFFYLRWFFLPYVYKWWVIMSFTSFTSVYKPFTFFTCGVFQLLQHLLMVFINSHFYLWYFSTFTFLTCGVFQHLYFYLWGFFNNKKKQITYLLQKRNK